MCQHSSFFTGFLLYKQNVRTRYVPFHRREIHLFSGANDNKRNWNSSGYESEERWIWSRKKKISTEAVQCFITWRHWVGFLFGVSLFSVNGISPRINFDPRWQKQRFLIILWSATASSTVCFSFMLLSVLCKRWSYCSLIWQLQHRGTY